VTTGWKLLSAYTRLRFRSRFRFDRRDVWRSVMQWPCQFFPDRNFVHKLLFYKAIYPLSDKRPVPPGIPDSEKCLPWMRSGRGHLHRFMPAGDEADSDHSGLLDRSTAH